MNTPKIILASQSSTRKRVLSQIGLNFEVIPSNYEEDMTLAMPPEELVQHLALGKARAVAKDHPDAVVIGCDTVLIFEGKVRGKPKDNTEALYMLKGQRGKKHTYYTGFAIVKGAKEVSGYALNNVWMRGDLSDEELMAYIEKENPSEKPTTKAGAYSGSDLGGVLIEKTEGDYFTALGLPLSQLIRGLKEFGVYIL